MSSVFSDSSEMSVNSGTLVCIRNAISYWLMRVAISGSPMSLNCWRFNWLTVSMIRFRESG